MVSLVDRLVGRQVAAGCGDRIAYLDQDGRISYAELHRAAGRYAARLAAAGIGPGTRGLVVADDAIATVVAILALWWRGALAVPVSPLLTAAELAFIARDCRAGFLHVDERAGALAAEAGLAGPGGPVRAGPDWAAVDRPAEPDARWEVPAPVPPVEIAPADPVLIQYTSGSTGRPKGVLHTATGVDGVLDGFGRVLDLRPDDTILSTAKLSFGYGFGNSLLFPLAAGARAVLVAGPPDVYRLVTALARYQPTVLCTVPRMYTALLDRARQAEPPDLGSVRLAVSAGEHLPAAICAGFLNTFQVPLINGLGATEVLHIVLATRGAHPGSTGTAVPGVTVTVRDDVGRVLPAGTEGRLHVAGPSVAIGYLDRPAETARCFADGGAYTGDIVRRDPGGEFRYVCRADDLINIGGHKVPPADIEAAVRDLDGLAQCVVVGSRDRDGLEQAVAYLVPAPGVDPAGLRRSAWAAFRANLPAAKRPAVVEVVDRLPVTSTGKLARYQLRRGGRAAAVDTPSVSDRADDPSAPAGPAVPAAAVTVRLRVLRDGPGRTIVCIPYAGGSCGSFTRLVRHLPRSWRVVAGEASYPEGATIAEATRAWWRACSPYLGSGSVLFGHSLGAVLAAAVTDATGDRLGDVQVVLSAPPLRVGARWPATVGADDEALLAGLSRAGLLTGTALTADELRRLVLPRLRRDLALAPDGFQGVRARPVHVLLGTDDVLCPPWALADRLPDDRIASLHRIPGDHYFVATNPEQTARVLAGLFPE